MSAMYKVYQQREKERTQRQVEFTVAAVIMAYILSQYIHAFMKWVNG